MRTPLKPLARAGGYSLIEMAIVILIVGVFIGVNASAYNLYFSAQATRNTENNVNLAVNAISNYLIQRGRYPCPARLDAQRTDADYGMETDCTDETTPPGECSGGLCIEQSTRQVTIPGSPPVQIYPRVRRGALPFRVLGLPEYFAEDGYRNRISYAVTERLAVAASYIRTHGGISLVDDQGKSLVTPDATAHYIVFSAGKDGKGAHAREGVLHLACGTGMDSENCNTEPSVPDAVYRLARANTSGGIEDFDDYVKFYTAVDTPLWKISDAEGYNIRDLVDAEDAGTGGKLGIGNANPALTLDVNGDALARQNLNLGQICSTSGANCFTPDKIGGAAQEMDCTNPAHAGYDPAKPYVVGVNNGRVVCDALPSIGCPSGQKMTGINADGSVVCSAFTGCQPTDVDVCLDPVTGLWDKRHLDVAVAGQTIWTAPPSGFSKQDQYVCQGGNWVLQSSTGLCTCTNTTTVETTSCDIAMGGGAWSGAGVEHTITHTCDAATGTDETTDVVTASDCTCQPKPSVATETNCPFGFSGEIVSTTSWVCDTPTSGSWTTPVITDNCVCEPRPPETGQSNCPDPEAYTGSYETKRDWQCPAGEWGDWYVTGGSCVCTNMTKQVEMGCPSGQTGSRIGNSTYDCSTDTWSDPVEISGMSTCSIPTYVWKAQSPAQPGTQGLGSKLLGTICPAPNTTTDCYSVGENGLYWYYPSCICQ